MTAATVLELPSSVDRPLLVHGDCIDVMRQLPAASVDVVLTDPPASIDFMNLEWDEFSTYQPRTRAGRNILRMLSKIERMDAAIQALTSEVAAARVDRKATKPKTVERRIAAAVEKALGRALKKAKAALAIEAGDLAEYAGIAPEFAGFVAFMTDVWTEVDRVLKPGGFVCGWALPKTADLAGLAMRAVGWEVHDSLLHLFGGGFPKSLNIGKALDKMHGAVREDMGPGQYAARGRVNRETCLGVTTESTAERITAPATPDALRWDGWGTQLAPGHEHWLIARKPTRLTYAQQVLTHGTGALHVDACRVPRGEALVRPAVMRDDNTAYAPGLGFGRQDEPGGSWPRNVVLSTGGDDCPADGLDRQSGVTSSKSGAGTPNRIGRSGGIMNASEHAREQRPEGHDDTGGASRYFTRFDDRVGYHPKASDRRAGLRTDITNAHPTHKNPALMDWLTRLLAATAEQTGDQPAVVLDPFMGSGTGGVSAVRCAVRYIGIELELEHYDVARARIMAAIGSPEAAASANDVAPVGAQLGML